MKVDREAFLFLAGALWACHAEHRRAADTEQLELVGTTAPVSPEAEPAVTTDASEPSAGDAGAGDASSAAEVDASDAAVSSPPPTPIQSLAQLRRHCAALSKPEPPGCPTTDTRAHMCRTVLAEFSPAAATRAVECLATLESSCDTCGIRTCAKNALEGLPTRPIAECNSVAKNAEQTSEGYGPQMRKLCERYASGMTAQGRARFSQCLKKHMGIGVRICLWDPSATPCTENSGTPPMLQ